MTVGLICSDGGHMTSMLQLSDAYEGKDVFMITYRSRRKPTRIQRVYYLRTIGVNPIYLIFGGLRTLSILIKERPSILLSTGAEIALPAMVIGRILGCKTVFLESISRSQDLSGTGRILMGMVDKFLIQWPELAQKYTSRAEYRGRLL
jgi:UDP-N-acetylglucosamine:LPS N-acetylglucosamine transferase